MVLTLTSGHEELDLSENGNDSDSSVDVFVSLVKRLLTQSVIFTQSSRGKINGTDREIFLLTNSNGYLFWPESDLPMALRSVGLYYVFNVTTNIADMGNNLRKSTVCRWSVNITASGRGINVRCLDSVAGGGSFQGVANIDVTLWYFVPPSAV